MQILRHRRAGQFLSARVCEDRPRRLAAQASGTSIKGKFTDTNDLVIDALRDGAART